MGKVFCQYFILHGKYTCQIISQSISSQNYEIIGFQGFYKSNSDVKRLVFDSCTFDEFPRNLHELFPNLSILWIDDCKLKSISRDDIGQLRGLHELKITYCGLKCLQGDLLRDLKQLKRVSFEGNKLGEIKPDILDGLQHLTFVSFIGNATIDTSFTSNFSNRVSLDALKAEIKIKCKLSGYQPVECEFSKFIFGEYHCKVVAQRIPCLQLKFSGEHKDGRSADDVEELCFEKCTFSEFPKNLHELFPKLSTLWMQNCTLGELNCEQIKEMKNLRRLQLHNCVVKNFKGEILSDLKQLTNISLQKNQIENVDLEMQKSKRILEFLCDEAFKDFTINVGEASFKIHKLLFAAHSATLAEIFKNNPGAVELNLQDIPEATFKVIYDFIYSEKLPENFDNWTELFAAANRLKIIDLTQISADQLKKSITDANAQDILELANKINNENLRERAFEHLIKKHFLNKIIKKELSRQPEKLKEMIERKMKLDQKHEEVMKEMETLEIEISQS